MVFNSFALIGFQSDEGVRRNQGRVGASVAPDCIRHALANLPYHGNDNGDYAICDMGNIICDGEHLEQAQTDLAKHVSHLRTNNYCPIILGGGHETSYGGLSGVHHTLPSDIRLGIINFDTHFDLRHTPDNCPTSGTPFWDTYRFFQNEGHEFNYFCMGIAQAGNTRALFQRASDLGVSYCLDRDCHLAPQDCLNKLLDFIALVDCLYISIDMDCFNGAIAPGVSALNPIGINPIFVEQCLQKILISSKVIAFDVVETNPKYDPNHLTIKLAARLIHTFVLSHLT